MRLKLKHITLSLSLLTLAVACKEEEAISINTPSEGKTPIELSVGGVDTPSPALTRAVITTPKEKMSNFDAITNIYFVMKSEYDTNNPDFGGSRDTKYAVSRGKVAAGSSEIEFDDTNKKYWDDAHARSTMLTLWAYAQKRETYYKDCTFEQENSNQSETDPLKKFVDETFDTDVKSKIDWRTKLIVPAIRVWKVSSTDQQTKASVNEQDLMFSNNLAKNGEASGDDKRLKFGVPTTGKFPTGENAKMIFYHAMSKITVKIAAGDGFTASSTSNDFNISSDNVILKGFNTSGTFHIGDGMFEYINGQTDTKMWLNTTNKNPYPAVYYTYEALAIPNVHGNVDGLTDTNSRFVKGENDLTDDKDVMMQFTIDNNTYKITSDALFDALMQHDGSGTQTNPVTNASIVPTNGPIANGHYIPLEAGKNYVFTFKISKTKISGITAQVVPWEVVNAEEQTPSNARINLNLEERGTDTFSENDKLSIYRTEDNPKEISDNHKDYKWETGYKASGNSNTLTKTSGTWKLPESTLWYWPNNMTYYHFRALYPTSQSVSTDETNTDNKYDYTSLSSAHNYTDVIWGAPMLDDNNVTPTTNGSFKWTYDAKNNKGFDVTNSSLESGNHQIYHAIGPTESTIQLTLFHMMSQVKFTITTSGDSSSDKVDLGNGTGDGYTNKTKLELVDYYNGGQLLLGNGLVKTTGDKTTTVLGPVYAGNDYNNLTWGIVPQALDGIKLRITTPDHNQYIVDLANIKVATEPSTANIANPYNKVGGTGDDKDKYIIDRWYPGFQYNYTLKLTKKGIDNITATVVNWETVTAEDEVQIQ